MSEHKGDTDWQSVAAALNSQLAAEQSRLAIEHEARLAVVDELAVEREKHEEAENIASSTQMELDGADKVIANVKRKLAAEKEVGHNTAVALGQQIIKLEDQLAAAQVTIKEYEDYIKELDKIALAKIEDQPMQLPMINDDPVVTLK